MMARAPTVTELEAIGPRAEAEVARRCKYVRLHMARRQIELLAPIQFHGSKHKDGVDMYLDPEKAEYICKDVAVALTICNDILKEECLPPLGLSVEGHTSASIHGIEESLTISSLRARRCLSSIRSNLKSLLVTRADALSGRRVDAATLTAWELNVFNGMLDNLLTYRGFGSRRPLPGLFIGKLEAAHTLSLHLMRCAPDC